MILRCIIVDDEPLARKFLEDYVRQIPFLQHAGSCKNAFEAMELLQKEPVDLMFLDIQMPGMLGTKFLASLREKPMVIFVTAYSNYAVESYDLDVVDYLMKPASFERFTTAVFKALDEKQKSAPVQPNIPVPEPAPDPDFFFVNVEYALVKISIPDITHIEGMKDYVKIFLQNAAKPILTKMTLKSILEKLPQDRFLRVQKSFIVNTAKVESIRNHQIMIGKHEIPASEGGLEELLKVLNFAK
ncbi:MAG: LytTR family DNA-binding domain-containing protein [Bacteroidota bacterium]